MKKIRAFVLAAVFIGCGAMTQTAQAQHVGALRSFLSSGEVSLGVGGGMESVTLSNEVYRQKVVYGKANLGLGKEWSVGGLVGVEDLDSDTQDGFTSGPVPFIAGSLGGPLFRGTILSIGPVVQASYVLMPFDGDSEEVEDMLKFSAAMLAQLEIDGSSLYFGPSLNFVDATLNGRDMEMERCFGGVVGIRWPLPGNWPTNESKTNLDLEIADNNFEKNRADVTLELNFTY